MTNALPETSKVYAAGFIMVELKSRDRQKYGEIFEKPPIFSGVISTSMIPMGGSNGER